MRKVILGLALGLAIGVGATFVALAQIAWPTLTGTEVWRIALVPGGTEQWATVNQVRNQHAGVVLSGATAAFTIGVPTANVTVTGTPGMTALTQGGDLLITAQPSALVITLPASPLPDGTIVGVCNASAAAFATNAVTLAANTNQTLAQAATLTTLAAGTCAREQWSLSNATWYRIQ